MPVHHPSLSERLESVIPAQPGLYIEPGINGTIVATIFDAMGKQIRQDHIAAEHFDPETLDTLTAWANKHQRPPAQLSRVS